MDALAESLLHPAYPLGAARLLPPGMLPLQMPQLFYPGLLSGFGLPPGVDGVSAAAAGVAPGASPALSSMAPVAPNYLIPVQAYPNLFLNRPPK